MLVPWKHNVMSNKVNQRYVKEKEKEKKSELGKIYLKNMVLNSSTKPFIENKSQT